MAHPPEFVGKWIDLREDCRIEQKLFADGRFEGLVFEPDGPSLVAQASGIWEVVDKSIHWHYKKLKNLRRPRKPDINRILEVHENFFVIRERDGSRTRFDRAVPCADTSVNMDMEQLQPLLERVAARVRGGFGGKEIAKLMRAVKRMKPDETRQFRFQIQFEGRACPFGIFIFMDDIDAPDPNFYGPVKLIRYMTHEIRKLDSPSKG